MKLSHDLQQQILDFLTSIPNIQDSKQQQALIFSAGLDQRLQGQIDFSSAPAQFVPVLVETLLKYGNLEDGRHALTAVLEAAKQYVGKNRQAECDELLRQFQTRRVASEGTPAEKPHIDPHWHLKIDRISQRDRVLAQTRLMMREQKPKSLAFVWYGQEGQGIEIFHKRLLVELREDLTNACVHQVRPRWPEHLSNYHDAFSDVLTEAFDARGFEDIPARVRADTHGKSTLIYVRHEPVRSTQLINPKSLREYVRWWDAEFAPLLEKKQFALLTVSFLVKNPPRFAEYVENEAIEELELRRTVFWLLDEMEKVAKRDLLLFLRTHNIDIPRDRKDKVLQKILNRTGGRYEQTVEELRKLRQEVWRGDKIGTPGKKVGGKVYDY
ncbi:MAG: hypothetical protein GY862_24280 [Gammaproteobacteria bacterium]|nr:hypothetical protein [Gammaproteobacteria bacterium]